MFLINSPPHHVRCALHCCRETLSRSYGRFFAEFLIPSYLDRLSILNLPTSVCSRYGLLYNKFRGFSRHQSYENKQSCDYLLIRLTIRCFWIFLETPSSLRMNRFVFSTPILKKLSHIPMRYPVTYTIGAGILTSFPSTEPFGIALGPG